MPSFDGVSAAGAESSAAEHRPPAAVSAPANDSLDIAAADKKHYLLDSNDTLQSACRQAVYAENKALFQLSPNTIVTPKIEVLQELLARSADQLESLDASSTFTLTKTSADKKRKFFDFLCALQQEGITYETFLSYPAAAQALAIELYVNYKSPSWWKAVFGQPNASLKAASYGGAAAVVERTLLKPTQQQNELLSSPGGIIITSVVGVALGLWFGLGGAWSNYKADGKNFEFLAKWFKAKQKISEQQVNANRALWSLLVTFKKVLLPVFKRHFTAACYFLEPEAVFLPFEAAISPSEQRPLSKYDNSLVRAKAVVAILNGAGSSLEKTLGKHGAAHLQQAAMLHRQHMAAVILSSLKNKQGGLLLSAHTMTELLNQIVDEQHSLTPVAMLELIESYDAFVSGLQGLVGANSEIFDLIETRNMLQNFAVPLYRTKHATSDEIVAMVDARYFKATKKLRHKLWHKIKHHFQLNQQVVHKLAADDSKQEKELRQGEIKTLVAAIRKEKDRLYDADFHQVSWTVALTSPIYYWRLRKKHRLDIMLAEKSLQLRSAHAREVLKQQHLSGLHPLLVEKLRDAATIVEMVDFIQQHHFELSKNALQQLSTFNAQHEIQEITQQVATCRTLISAKKTAIDKLLDSVSKKAQWVKLDGRITYLNTQLQAFNTERARSEQALSSDVEKITKTADLDQTISQLSAKIEIAKNDLCEFFSSDDVTQLQTLEQELALLEYQHAQLIDENQQLQSFKTVAYLQELLKILDPATLAAILVTGDFNQLPFNIRQLLLNKHRPLTQLNQNGIPESTINKLSASLLPKINNPFYRYFKDKPLDSADMLVILELITWYPRYEKWRQENHEVIEYTADRLPAVTDDNKIFYYRKARQHALNNAPELSKNAKNWLLANAAHVTDLAAEDLQLQIKAYIPTAKHWLHKKMNQAFGALGKFNRTYLLEPFKSWFWPGFRVFQNAVIIASLYLADGGVGGIIAASVGAVVGLSLWAVGIKDTVISKNKLDKAADRIKDLSTSEVSEQLIEELQALQLTYATEFAQEFSAENGDKQRVLVKFHQDLSSANDLDITGVALDSSLITNLKQGIAQANSKRNAKSALDFLDATYSLDNSKRLEETDFLENRFAKPTLFNAFFPAHRTYTADKWLANKFKAFGKYFRGFWSTIWRVITSGSLLDGVAYGVTPVVVCNTIAIIIGSAFISMPPVIITLAVVGSLLFLGYFFGTAYNNYQRDKENYEAQCKFDKACKENQQQRFKLKETLALLKEKTNKLIFVDDSLKQKLNIKIAELEKLQQKLDNFHRLTKLTNIEARLNNISITDDDYIHLLSLVTKLQRRYVTERKISDGQPYGKEITDKLASLAKTFELRDIVIPPQETIGEKARRWARRTVKHGFFGKGHSESNAEYITRGSNSLLRAFWPGFRIQVTVITIIETTLSYAFLPVSAVLFVAGMFAARNETRIAQKKIELGQHAVVIHQERVEQTKIAEEMKLCVASINTLMAVSHKPKVQSTVSSPLLMPNAPKISATDVMNRARGAYSILSEALHKIEEITSQFNEVNNEKLPEARYYKHELDLLMQKLKPYYKIAKNAQWKIAAIKKEVSQTVENEADSESKRWLIDRIPFILNVAAQQLATANRLFNKIIKESHEQPNERASQGSSTTAVLPNDAVRAAKIRRNQAQREYNSACYQAEIVASKANNQIMQAEAIEQGISHLPPIIGDKQVAQIKAERLRVEALYAVARVQRHKINWLTEYNDAAHAYSILKNPVKFPKFIDRAIDKAQACTALSGKYSIRADEDNIQQEGASEFYSLLIANFKRIPFCEKFVEDFFIETIKTLEDDDNDFSEGDLPAAHVETLIMAHHNGSIAKLLNFLASKLVIKEQGRAISLEGRLAEIDRRNDVLLLIKSLISDLIKFDEKTLQAMVFAIIFFNNFISRLIKILDPKGKSDDELRAAIEKEKAALDSTLQNCRDMRYLQRFKGILNSVICLLDKLKLNENNSAASAAMRAQLQDITVSYQENMLIQQNLLRTVLKKSLSFNQVIERLSLELKLAELELDSNYYSYSDLQNSLRKEFIYWEGAAYSASQSLDVANDLTCNEDARATSPVQEPLLFGKRRASLGSFKTSYTVVAKGSTQHPEEASSSESPAPLGSASSSLQRNHTDKVDFTANCSRDSQSLIDSGYSSPDVSRSPKLTRVKSFKPRHKRSLSVSF